MALYYDKCCGDDRFWTVMNVTVEVRLDVVDVNVTQATAVTYVSVMSRLLVMSSVMSFHHKHASSKHSSKLKALILITDLEKNGLEVKQAEWLMTVISQQYCNVPSVELLLSNSSIALCFEKHSLDFNWSCSSGRFCMGKLYLD